MRAVVFNQFGGPTVAHVREVEAPAPGPGEVLIEVVAASANPADLSRMAGRFGRWTSRASPGSTPPGW